MHHLAFWIMGSSFIIHTCFHYQRHNDNFLTGKSTLPPHMIATSNLDQAHINAHPSYHFESHSDPNKVIRAQITMTGPTQCTMALV